MSENKLKPTSIAKKQAKSTKAEVDQRVSEIKDLLLSGQTRSDILKYASKWGLSDTQVDLYTATARQEIQEIVQQDSQADLTLILRNLWDIINKNKATNPQVARQALMDIAKLRGMDQITVNHTFKRDENLAKLSEDDFEAAMQKAMEERH